MQLRGITTILLSVISTLIIVETVLRCFDFKPQVYTNYKYFNLVDSLSTYENFCNDSLGIYRFSSLVSDSQKLYNQLETLPPPSITGKLHPIDNTWNTYEEFNAIERNAKANNCNGTELCETLQSAGFTKSNHNDTAWAQLIRAYIKAPFNAEGFKGISLQAKPPNERPKIMLVGDSFVYGVSCSPITNSFSDRLLARGYVVYNFGIPGTDPAQYWQIVNHYAPILKPDVVIVCFFPGNDLMNYKRKVDKNQPLEYITNAGVFFSNICGKFYPSNQAYEFYKNLCLIPPTNWFNRFCSCSSIGTLLWATLYKLNVVDHSQRKIYENCNRMSYATIANTKYYINNWSSFCKQKKIKLINAVLPEIANDKPMYNDLMLDKLFGTNYCHPPLLTIDKEKHFAKNDQHFNSNGNYLFADYLDSLIKVALH